MRRFPHTKRSHRSGHWIYFRRFPLRAQSAIGRVFFERSLKTADLAQLADRWASAHREFEMAVQRAYDGSAQSPAKSSILQTIVKISKRSVRQEYEQWDKNIAPTLEPLNLDLEALRGHIKTWGDWQRYERAQRLLRDPAYLQNDDTFRAECREVGAFGERRNWLIHSPRLYELAQEIASKSTVDIPPLHGAIFVIERMVENELKEVLEAEGRWKNFDFKDMPNSEPKQSETKMLAPNGEPYIPLSDLVARFSRSTRKPTKTTSKLRMIARYLKGMTETGITIEKLTRKSCWSCRTTQCNYLLV